MGLLDHKRVIVIKRSTMAGLFWVVGCVLFVFLFFFGFFFKLLLLFFSPQVKMFNIHLHSFNSLEVLISD